MENLNMETAEKDRIEVLHDRFRQMERDGRTVEAVVVEGELAYSYGIWLKGGFLN